MTDTDSTISTFDTYCSLITDRLSSDEFKNKLKQFTLYNQVQETYYCIICYGNCRLYSGLLKQKGMFKTSQNQNSSISDNLLSHIKSYHPDYYKKCFTTSISETIKYAEQHTIKNAFEQHKSIQ